jgi:hypothetical protein
MGNNQSVSSSSNGLVFPIDNINRSNIFSATNTNSGIPNSSNSFNAGSNTSLDDLSP